MSMQLLSAPHAISAVCNEHRFAGIAELIRF